MMKTIFENHRGIGLALFVGFLGLVAPLATAQTNLSDDLIAVAKLRRFQTNPLTPAGLTLRTEAVVARLKIRRV